MAAVGAYGEDFSCYLLKDARVARAVRQVEGKRLMYRESVGNPPYAPAGAIQPDAPFTE